MPGTVASYTIDFPTDWVKWHVGEGPSREDELAEMAADGPAAQRLVRHAVNGLDALCRLGGVFFVGTVDLRDEAARRRSVSALVERQVGRDDSPASLRGDLRSQLGRAADDAARAGGRIMAVSLMRADGIPVPATLTMYRVPGAALDDRGAEELARLLRASQQQDDEIEIAHGLLGPVLRRVSRRQGDASIGGSDVTLLLVDYWLDPTDAHGLMQLSFSSPLLELREGLLELFDAVVASVSPAEAQS